MDLDAFGRGCFLNKVWVIPNNLDESCGFIGERIGVKGWKAGLIVGNSGDVVNKVALCLSSSIYSSSVFQLSDFLFFMIKLWAIVVMTQHCS